MTDHATGDQLPMVQVTALITINGTEYGTSITTTAKNYDGYRALADHAAAGARRGLAEQVRRAEPNCDADELINSPDIEIIISRYTMDLTDAEENDQ